MRSALQFGLISGLLVMLAIALHSAWQYLERPERQPATQTAASAPPPSAAPAVPAPIAPSFDVVRVAADGSVVMAGRAEPDATVIILDGDAEIGRVNADRRGEWVFTPELRLAPGRHELYLRATVAGARTLLGSEPVVIVVPEAAGGPVLALKQLGQGGTVVLQGPAALAGAGPLTIDNVDYEDGRMAASGRASPGHTVVLYLDNAPLGTVSTDQDGRWRLSPVTQELTEGTHVLRADQIERDGKVSARTEVSFMTTGIQPASVTVEPGNSLWRIARRTYGDGTAYTLIFQANRAHIRDPDLIYPGQILELPRN